MKLSDLRGLCDQATPGPWIHDWGNSDIETGRPERSEIVIRGEHPNYEANLEFIAAARTYLPKLLAIAEAVEAIINHPDADVEDLVSCGLYQPLKTAYAALESE